MCEYCKDKTCHRCVANFSDYLSRNYSSDELQDIVEDGLNLGGDLTRDLYFAYYSDIWGLGQTGDIGKFANHTEMARYMLSEAAKYYALEIINELS